MTTTLFVSLFACVSPTILASTSEAAETDYCKLSCVDLAENRVEVCEEYDEGDCTTSGSDFYDQCVADCPLSVTLPTAAEMPTYAKAVAADLWGSVTLIETHTYLHADGDPNTYLFAFSTDSKASLDSIDWEALTGEDMSGYDDTLYFLEMGARLELPPIVAYWNGISREQALLGSMETQVLKGTDSTQFEVTERWGTAVMPVFVLDTTKGDLYYHPNSGILSESATVSVNSDLRDTDAYLTRLERLKREWAAFLGTLPAPSSN
ncbi:MAG: hypothetical protein VX899_17490 [Myxococcota bacterium]|nr:hypothetical protein [Myxococcota bacterium]